MLALRIALFALVCFVAVAGPYYFRYVQFIPRQYRGATNSRQWSELYMLSGGNGFGDPVVSAGGSHFPNEGPDKVVDYNLGTKFCSEGDIYSAFEFDYKSSVAIDGYRFCTANDFPDRDPVTWTITGSLDRSVWVLLHEQNDQNSVPQARQACITIDLSAPTALPTPIPTASPTFTPLTYPQGSNFVVLRKITTGGDEQINFREIELYQGTTKLSYSSFEITMVFYILQNYFLFSIS